MTTHSDDASHMDETAAVETPDAMSGDMRVTKARKGARGNTAAAARAAADAHAAAVASAASAASNDAPALALTTAWFAAHGAGGDVDEVDDGATREVAAVTSSGSLASAQTLAHPAPFSAPLASAAPVAAPATAPLADLDDPDATIVRPPHSADVSLDQPMTEPAPPRPRYNTLAGAFNRSRASASDPAAPATPVAPPAAPPDAVLPPAQTPTTHMTARMAQVAPPTAPDVYDDFIDEVDDEDEWSLADQPTVQWTPEQIRQMQRLKPDFLQTGEQPSWPPRPGAARPAPESDASHHDWRAGLPPRPRPPFPMQGAPRPLATEGRLAAPDGRVAPSAPSASVAGAQPDPRMERFQELRRQRFAHEEGVRDEADPAPTADAVRQWWNDLRPALQNALRFQREARASGMHPIPAYELTAVSRMGDAFGRLAASARELSERAQQAAAPTIKRIHDQVEQAAQGIISRFEGDTVRQQAPLLGPGRIAIFFRQGVSVGQAQRLLAASAARPMRLIPRKHGFLARVQQGKEAEVCERLRQHPYVSDVVYLEFNEYGEPVGGRR